MPPIKLAAAMRSLRPHRLLHHHSLAPLARGKTHRHAHNSAHAAVLGVHVEHLLERERRANINVADEDVVWDWCAENGVAEVVQAACCAEGFVFAEVADVSNAEVTEAKPREPRTASTESQRLG